MMAQTAANKIATQRILERAYMALEDEPETIRLAGRKILVEQAPYILADISAAKKVLESLLRNSTRNITSSSITKQVDCD